MTGTFDGYTVLCGRCQRPLQIRFDLSGQTVACPYCGEQFHVRQPEATPVIVVPRRSVADGDRSDASPTYRAHYILAATATALVLTLVGVIGRRSAPAANRPTPTQSVVSSDSRSDNRLVLPNDSGNLSQTDFAVVADRFSRLCSRALPELKQVHDVRFDVVKTNSVSSPLRAQLQFDATVETRVWIPKSENAILPLIPASAKIRYVTEYAWRNNTWQFGGSVSSTWLTATLAQNLEATRVTPFARQAKLRADSWLKREMVGRSFQHDAELITAVSRDEFRARANDFTPSSSSPLSPDTSENGQTYPELYDIVQFLQVVSMSDVEKMTLPLYAPTFASRSKLAREGTYDEQLAAAKDLGSMGTQAIPVLATLALAPDVEQEGFRAEDDALRIAAIKSLTSIGPESIPTLLKCLDDKSSTVQDEAALALASFGARAAEAVPKLQLIAKTRTIPFVSNRKLASAIRQIDPNADVPAEPSFILKGPLP